MIEFLLFSILMTLIFRFGYFKNLIKGIGYIILIAFFLFLVTITIINWDNIWQIFYGLSIRGQKTLSGASTGICVAIFIYFLQQARKENSNPSTEGKYYLTEAEEMEAKAKQSSAIKPE